MTLLGDRDSVSDLAERIWSEQQTSEAAQWAVVTLANAGRYDPARTIAAQSGLKTAPFAQPGITRPMTNQERDAVFALAVLDVQSDAVGRPLGEPAMARGRFARVRTAAPAGSDLWFAALRGELQALDQLDAQNEAASLTAELQAALPELQFPPEILARIGKA
jgi:hypothetical protein